MDFITLFKSLRETLKNNNILCKRYSMHHVNIFIVEATFLRHGRKIKQERKKHIGL